MTFYSSNGIAISKEEFVVEYSTKYFDYPQNSIELKKIILNIVNKGFEKTGDDIATLMRWKLNARNIKGDLVNCYGRKIKYESCVLISKEISKYHCYDNAMDIYNRLLNLKLSGFGTVYLLTLVWAVSKMNFPIYDKFASISIDSIIENKKPIEIEYIYPPDKIYTKKVEQMYLAYQEK